MKRMKKKVVAMVTLAMFVMTLLPMAAFAATNPANPQASSFATVEANPTVKVGAEVDAEFDVNGDNLSQAVVEPFNHVTIWATENGKVSNALEVWTVDKDGVPDAKATPVANYGYNVSSVNDNQRVVLKFSRAGEYTIHAAAGQAVIDVDAADVLNKVEGHDVVTVQNPDFVADTVAVAPNSWAVDKVDMNKVETKKVDLTVTAKEGVLNGQVVALENNNSDRGLKVVDAALGGKEITEVALDNNGKATFYLLAEKKLPADTYYVNALVGGKKATVTVTVTGPKEVADSIEALPVKSPLNIDKTSSASKVNAEVADKVRFEIKNAEGQAITAAEGEPALGAKVEGLEADYIVVEGPRHFKKIVLNAKTADQTPDVKLVPVADTKEMTLAFANNKVLDKKGEYTATVYLANGAKAVSTFTVGEFGTTQSIEIAPDVDTVVLNEKGTAYKVYAVDENGMKNDVTDSIDQNGIGYDPVKNDLGVDVTKPNVKASYAGESKDVLGTKITLTVEYKDAAQDNKAFLDKHEFTVVDKSALADYELVFDSNEGKVLTKNVVKVAVENVNGNTVGKDLTIKELYVDKLSQSNKAAKVNVAAGSDKKSIEIYADKATTVDVQVVAWTTDNTVYSGTLTYKVGEVAEDPFADTLVALTIGSKEMIVNNEVVKIDAAPYVDKNWRTMVPLSAITEAFGVTPEWNEKDRTVTVEKDGVKIVMTIDKQTYTVNGKEAKMDTAPVIVNSRTMVPVRFIAEDLGFKVAPLYSTVNGTTEGVVITK